jgi:16S rRNA (cytosine967-C5)-methyltransferase
MDTLVPDTLETKYSVPNWIIESFEKELGTEETEEVLKAFQKQSPVTIRLNTFKGSPEEILEEIRGEGYEIEEVDARFNIYKLKNISSLSMSKTLSEGKFYIQDYSSMCPIIYSGIRNGMSVIDVCAAPGGKSIMAAEFTKDGHVVSCDVSEKKAAIIEENANRMGASNLEVRVQDATVFNPEFEGKFDVAILDLPCSGLGVIGRKADMKYRLLPQDLATLASLQRKIIDNVKRYIKKGGRIVFSTCTIDKLENEDNKDYILKTNANLEMVFEKKILPQEYGSDGFYIAVFEDRK